MSHQVYDNSSKGFKKLLKVIEDNAIVVMEASAPYYFCLASYLYNHSVSVLVVNPLMIKRFSQMRFYKAKTDE